MRERCLGTARKQRMSRSKSKSCAHERQHMTRASITASSLAEGGAFARLGANLYFGPLRCAGVCATRFSGGPAHHALNAHPLRCVRVALL